MGRAILAFLSAIGLKLSTEYSIQHASVIIEDYQPGPGCSKLTTSLVNVSLKFQMLISQIFQYFLLKKCEKLL